MTYEVKHYVYLKSDAPYMGTSVPYARTIGQIMDQEQLKAGKFDIAMLPSGDRR